MIKTGKCYRWIKSWRIEIWGTRHPLHVVGQLSENDIFLILEEIDPTTFFILKDDVVGYIIFNLPLLFSDSCYAEIK